MPIIQVPIGDWSGDGHNIVDYETCTFDDENVNWKEAYDRAKELYPELDPSSFFDGYEDTYLPPIVEAKWQELGYDIDPDGFDHYDNYVKFICWFFNQGWPGLNMRVGPRLPHLNMYQISGSFGYGLRSV